MESTFTILRHKLRQGGTFSSVSPWRDCEKNGCLQTARGAVLFFKDKETTEHDTGSDHDRIAAFGLLQARGKRGALRALASQNLGCIAV